MPKGNRYDAEHLRNISSYQRQIDEIFKRAAEVAARIAESSGAEHDPDKVFSFDDYPSVRKRVDKMTSDLSSRVERTIVNGIKAQWDLSNRKNDDLVETVTGLKADDFPSDQRKRYFGTNESARRAFLDRREKGLSLSDKVWKQSERFRKDMELGIDVSLGEGMSADELGRRLRGYLNHPETLFSRVRDERGNLVLSKNAAVFHPGRGVYRSSYMNARRLAATETNMAYRSADYERWKDLDFVVGIEIRTSNNHTTKDSKGKPQPLEDICDTLAGRYPKGFKFVGWHPHCRCIATTILKTEEEMAKDTERIMNGEEPLPAKDSENYEGSVSEKFDRWVMGNLKRIEEARNKGTLPYFLKDNEEYLNKVIPPTLRHLYEAIANYPYTDPELKAREKEIVAKLRELFDNSDFGTEVRHEYLADILQDGFKNTFQTGTSGGYTGSSKTSGIIEEDHKRLGASHRMFSAQEDGTDIFFDSNGNIHYTGTQLERAEYEKYGYLLDKNKADYRNNSSGYGDVQVRFKKDKVKCTWTFDDTLANNGAATQGEYLQPTLISDPGVESFNKRLGRSADDLLAKSDWKNVSQWIVDNKSQYVELQYHGDLNADCIESMTFKRDPRGYMDADVLDGYKKKGVELWYVEKGKLMKL